MKSLNYDTGKIVDFNKTPQGYLKVRIRVTKPGVFTYNREKYGYGLVKELKKPSEVFSAKNLKSIASSVITHEHPVTDGKSVLIDPKNTKDFMVGYPCSQPVIEDNKYISIDTIITDQSAINAIVSGKRDISLGSSSSVRMSPGSWNGFKYDWEHYDIESNHIALTSQGRCGPDVAVVSSFDSIAIQHNEGVNNTMKIEIDGETFEVEDRLGKIINNRVMSVDSEKNELIDQLKSSDRKNIKLEALYDQLESDHKELKHKLDSYDKNDVSKKVKELMDLFKQANRLLEPSEVESFDSISDPTEFKLNILKKKSPNFNFDEKSPEYIEARYDVLIESIDSARDKANDLGSSIIQGRFLSTDAASMSKAEQARNASIERDKKRWMNPYSKLGE